MIPGPIEFTPEVLAKLGEQTSDTNTTHHAPIGTINEHHNTSQHITTKMKGLQDRMACV